MESIILPEQCARLVGVGSPGLTCACTNDSGCTTNMILFVVMGIIGVIIILWCLYTMVGLFNGYVRFVTQMEVERSVKKKCRE
jgi:hypothetical protein